MVFYRKYRPQKIEDLDSEQVRSKLFSVLSAKEISHAFLFTGPKGLGKTSTARIVAKIVNCTGRTSNKKQLTTNKSEVSSQKLTVGSIEPCNKCEQCVSITEGRNFDVLEIDAASNRGIDEIRDLREKIRLAPMRSAKKVYIIDEVHMLTQEAFDALLKTLEEPPAHALFILCTTEPQKVPPTIVSRCVHITFNKATTEELVRAFQRIAKGEDLKVDKEVLLSIAGLSDGSFRDGTKILEELAQAANGKKITKDLLESSYKVSSLGRLIEDLLKEVSAKNIKGALKLINEISKQGIDMKHFTDQLMEALHKILLFQFNVTSSAPAAGFSSDEIKRLVELLSKYYPQLKYSVIPQLPIEMAIIEYCQNESSGSLPHVADDARPAISEKPDSSRSLSESLSQSQSSKNTKPAFSSSANGQPTLTPEGLDRGRQTSIEQRTSGAKSFFQELIEEVKSHNHSIAGVLRGCSAEIDGNKVTIATKYKFHKERLEEKETLEVLEKVSSELIGKKAVVSVILNK
ncbi:MAG: DNA polymerase III subunit gamma/tau [Candidatus Levyibacteriota bacterium]